MRDGLLGFGGAFVLYLPWVPTTLYQAAHTGAPWSDQPAIDSLLGVPGVLLGRMPQIVLLICAGAGLLALLQRRDGRLSDKGRVVIALVILGVGTPVLAWALSQASPAWANRYLAVALAPYLLLAAAGSRTRAGSGIVGLVLVVIMWAQDAAPVEKSNVRAVAHAIGPSLAPGDLVISTQPETIPVLHYYLPDGLRYATLTGEVQEYGVWDWRDGVERLEATSAERNLDAADRLAAGRHPRRAWSSRSRRRSTGGRRRGRRWSGSAPRSGRRRSRTTRACRSPPFSRPSSRRRGRIRCRRR